MSKFFNKNINFFLQVELHFATNFAIFNTTFCDKMGQIEVFCGKTQQRNLSHHKNGSGCQKMQIFYAVFFRLVLFERKKQKTHSEIDM